MITSLLEPCLIIPNYASRHLILSVSPTVLPAHSWLDAACVCSVTLISSMSMFPHLSRLQRWDLRSCFNNTAWYCPGGSLLLVSGSSLFLQFVTQFTQTWSMQRFRPYMWQMHRRTGTTCTHCRGKKNLQSRQEGLKCLY